MKRHRLFYERAAILALSLTAVLCPTAAHGQNMNLSGSLNVNDYQMTSTSNLLLSMVVTLAESIIPIIVGAAVGHKSITHWQEKKDRIARANRMTDNYSQSVKLHDVLLQNFVRKVFKAYIIFQKPGGPQTNAVEEFTSVEDNIGGYLRFPTDPAQLPSKQFLPEFEEISSKIDGLSHTMDRLYIDLKSLQKGGKKLLERLQVIRALQKRAELVTASFLNSSQSDEFISSRRQFHSLCDLIKSETDNFELELSELKSG